MIKKVVIPNVFCMLLVVGYEVLMFMVLVPQMDLHRGFDAFLVFESVLLGLYGLGKSVARIMDAYHEKWQWELDHYKSVKETFALFNKYSWDPEWNLRDFPNDLSEAIRLGIDKELPTARDCRLYLFGWDPEENRPPKPNFNSQHTMIEFNGKWHTIPEHYYGKLMDEGTIQQIVDEVRSANG